MSVRLLRTAIVLGVFAVNASHFGARAEVYSGDACGCETPSRAAARQAYPIVAYAYTYGYDGQAYDGHRQAFRAGDIAGLHHFERMQ